MDEDQWLVERFEEQRGQRARHLGLANARLTRVPPHWLLSPERCMWGSVAMPVRSGSPGEAEKEPRMGSG